MHVTLQTFSREARVAHPPLHLSRFYLKKNGHPGGVKTDTQDGVRSVDVQAKQRIQRNNERPKTVAHRVP